MAGGCAAHDGHRMSLDCGLPQTGQRGGTIRMRVRSQAAHRNAPGRPHPTQSRGNRQSRAKLRAFPTGNTEAMPREPTLVTSGAQFTAQDRLVEVDLAVPYLDVVAAIRISTNPSLVPDRRPLAPEVRQGNEVALVTLLAFWEWSVLQGSPPPSPDMTNYCIVFRSCGQMPAFVCHVGFPALSAIRPRQV